MYDTGGLMTWNEPEFTDFNPKIHHEAVRNLGVGSDGLLLRYKHYDLTEEEETEVVYGREDSTGRVHYLLSNRACSVRTLLRPRAFINPPKDVEPIDAPILPDDHIITEESEVGFIPIGSNSAMYYRDLFAHRLGVTNARMHNALIVDGYVAGVVGTESEKCERGMKFKARGSDEAKLYIEEIYGFNVTNLRYPRLNRLLMMLICTKQFIRTQTSSIYDPEGITTTCLCQHPELKINRGILKLVDREKMANNMYKLRYAADANDRTYTEVVKEWLRKHGKSEFSKLEKVSKSGASTSTS